MSKLLKGERLHAMTKGSGVASSASSTEIDSKYARGEIRMVTEQARYPLSSIVQLLGSGDYKLDPEFQRRHRWNVAKKSRLIESLIMNVPIPPVFLYEDRYSHYEVMDGLQRLTAIREFYQDAFALTELSEWPELNGRTYSKLPDQVRRGIDRRYISSIILLHETAKTSDDAIRLKQMVFERINSGGIKLEPQESRNAIYDGPLNRLCLRLATLPDFRFLWGISVNDSGSSSEETDDAETSEIYRTMEDVELVLRFFAYRQREEQHQGALKDYLDFYLREGNRFSPETLLGLESIFSQTIALAKNLLGQKAFKPYRKRKTGWVWFDRPTTVVYDPLMYALSDRLGAAKVLLEKRESVRAGLDDFYKANAGEFEGRYTNKSNLKARNRLFCEYLDMFA